MRRRIVEDGPIGYWTSLDIEAMATAAQQLGENAVFSHDAGGYVCNHLFFIAAHRTAAASMRTMNCGFVHLPQLVASGDRLSRLIDLVTVWLTETLTSRSGRVDPEPRPAS